MIRQGTVCRPRSGCSGLTGRPCSVAAMVALDELLKSMEPVLNAGRYAFVSVPAGHALDPRSSSHPSASRRGFRRSCRSRWRCSKASSRCSCVRGSPSRCIATCGPSASPPPSPPRLATRGSAATSSPGVPRSYLRPRNRGGRSPRDPLPASAECAGERSMSQGRQRYCGDGVRQRWQALRPGRAQRSSV